MTDEIDDPRPPSVRLVGGGRDAESIVALFAAFVEDAATRRDHDGRPPRIHALLVLEDDDEESTERFYGLLTRAGGDVVAKVIREGEHFDASAIDGADGLFVGGGLTPAYHDAFQDIAPLVRERAAAGTPYLGFSAGAAIAPQHALIGGYSIGGVPVADEEAGEELEDVTIVPGLGLVPFSIDVHAAQWGTVSRLIAAVAAGLVESGFAVDEHTALHWRAGGGDSTPVVSGRGAAWHVTTRAEGGVSVHRFTG